MNTTTGQHMSQDQEKSLRRPLLITTRTCPACRMATELLDKKGIEYQKVYAEETPEIAHQYHIRGVPVLIMPLPNGEIRQLKGFSEIKKYF